MGWSARVEACETFDAWARVCVAQTGKQNVYRVPADDAARAAMVAAQQAERLARR
jgi:hypothetical protein